MEKTVVFFRPFNHHLVLNRTRSSFLTSKNDRLGTKNVPHPSQKNYSFLIIVKPSQRGSKTCSTRGSIGDHLIKLRDRAIPRDLSAISSTGSWHWPPLSWCGFRKSGDCWSSNLLSRTRTTPLNRLENVSNQRLIEGSDKPLLHKRRRGQLNCI